MGAALAVLAGGWLGRAREARADAPPAAKHRYVVAAIGDSLTDARSGGGGYLRYVGARCPASRFDNYGKGGEMVNQMRARFARDVLGEGAAEADTPGAKPRYTHVIVFGGVNDLYSDLTAGRTPAKVEGDLSAMYEAAHQHGIQVIAITVAPWGGFSRYYNARRGAATLELNRWIGAQAKSGGADAMLDAYGLLSCGEPTRLCKTLARKDQIHLNESGQEKLGAALYGKIFADCE